MTDARETNDLDLGHDLEITKVTPRVSAGGAWVCGRLNAHRFEALVFAEHAESADYELRESRISKLGVRRLADNRLVFSFDRGMDVDAVDQAAAEVVGFLAAGLADHIYAK